MEAVTIKKNGLKVCTAPVGLTGTMTVFIRWATHGEKIGYTVSVMGIDGEKERFVNWDVPGITGGDEIAIKLDTATESELTNCPSSQPAHHGIVAGILGAWSRFRNQLAARFARATAQ